MSGKPVAIINSVVLGSFVPTDCIIGKNVRNFRKILSKSVEIETLGCEVDELNNDKVIQKNY